jgi:hypothetical protein
MLFTSGTRRIQALEFQVDKSWGRVVGLKVTLDMPTQAFTYGIFKADERHEILRLDDCDPRAPPVTTVNADGSVNYKTREFFTKVDLWSGTHLDAIEVTSNTGKKLAKQGGGGGGIRQVIGHKPGYRGELIGFRVFAQKYDYKSLEGISFIFR